MHQRHSRNCEGHFRWTRLVFGVAARTCGVYVPRTQNQRSSCGHLPTGLGTAFDCTGQSCPGCPDLVFPRLRKTIFVHGCFWHQHSRCVDGRVPKSRRRYWIPKLKGNRERDKRNRTKLKQLGWRSLVVWDCQTLDTAELSRRLIRFLES